LRRLKREKRKEKREKRREKREETISLLIEGWQKKG